MAVDDGDTTFTVGGLTEAINQQLRAGFGRGVWVAGEVSGLRASGAHVYFSLVEEIDGAKATLAVSLFANVKRTVMPKLAANRVELTDGTKVRIRGSLDVYAPSGRLSLKVSDIDPQFTLGDITAARDAVLARLSAEDLIERNGRLPMPIMPLRIGVVTSIGSAAWHDFRDEIERYGHYSLAAESMYDHPFQWGSKRTGPDLARVGGKYSDEWHRTHLIAPRSLVPESVMPGYPFLATKPLRYDDIAAHLKANRAVGVPYDEAMIAAAVGDVEAQVAPDTKEADALKKP